MPPKTELPPKKEPEKKEAPKDPANEPEKGGDKPAILDFQPAANSLFDTENLPPEKSEQDDEPKPEPKKKQAAKKGEEKPDDEPRPDRDKMFEIDGDDDEPDDEKEKDSELEDEPDDEPEKDESELTDEEKKDRKAKNSRLRNELKKANENAKAAESRASEAESRAEDLESKLKASEARATDLEKRVTYRDPSTHPEVQKIYHDFNARLAERTEIMNFGSDDAMGDRLGNEIQSLVTQYQRLGDKSSEGYAQRFDALKDHLSENYSGSEKDVFELVKQGASALESVQSKVKEISENGAQFSYQESKGQYDMVRERYLNLTKGAFEPSQELRETDPLHPSVIIRDLLDAEAEDGGSELADALRKINRFAERAMVPLAPLSPDDVAKIPEGERQAKMNERLVEWTKTVDQAQQVLPVALMSYRLLPKLAEENMRLRQALEEKRGAKPKLGSDDLEHEHEEEEDDAPGDIKKFEPSNQFLDNKK